MGGSEVAEQYTPGHLGELITDEQRDAGGWVGICYDGFDWRVVPPYWWAVAIPGAPIAIMPPSRYETWRQDAQ